MQSVDSKLLWFLYSWYKQIITNKEHESCLSARIYRYMYAPILSVSVATYSTHYTDLIIEWHN